MKKLSAGIWLALVVLWTCWTPHHQGWDSLPGIIVVAVAMVRGTALFIEALGEEIRNP